MEYNRSMSPKLLPLPRLLKGEKIIYIKNFDERTPKQTVSSLKALESLAKAKRYADIGKYGPVVAAESLKDHSNEREFTKYNAIFGRDSLRVAVDLIKEYPKLAKATLIRLAELQGLEFNEWREEEVGKIIHEYRDPVVDPIARELIEQRGWDWPYYGSIDSTLEYLKTFNLYCKLYGYSIFKQIYVGRDKKKHEMSFAYDMAIYWTLNKLKVSSNDLIEFKSLNPNGIENQAWKDSWDSYFHHNGLIANHKYGIASIEVQAAGYDALVGAINIYDKYFKDLKKVLELSQKVQKIKENIFNLFWTDISGGYFVLGTDRDKGQKPRQLRIRTSNMGHLLNSEIFSINNDFAQDRVHKIIKQLFSKELLSFSGIRTLASDEIRFRPGAYHNGSVWIWDNYLIAQGLEKQGYYRLAYFIEKIILDDVNTVKRLPEYFRGDLTKTHLLNSRIVEVEDKINNKINRLEQPPQDIQAWTVASILAIKSEKKPPLKIEDSDKYRFEEDILKSIWF